MLRGTSAGRKNWLIDFLCFASLKQEMTSYLRWVLSTFCIEKRGNYCHDLKNDVNFSSTPFVLTFE